MQGGDLSFPTQPGSSSSLYSTPEQRQKWLFSRKAVVPMVGETDQTVTKWDCVGDKCGRGWRKSERKGPPKWEVAGKPRGYNVGSQICSLGSSHLASRVETRGSVRRLIQ